MSAKGIAVALGGRWAIRLTVLLALPVFFTGLYCTNYVFLAAPTHYRCLIEECESGSEVTWHSEWVEWSQPMEQCRRWKALDTHCTAESFDNSTGIQCERFVYKSTSSIVAEFDLACQEWKRTLVGTIHNIGMLLSLPMMGYVSDRWGRRMALVVSGTGAGVLGLIKSFSTSYNMFVTMEILETMFGASVYPASFVLLIEWLSVEQRILTSLLLGFPLATGVACIALLDYLTGYWRLWAQIAYPPSFILLLYPFLLPESIRWLCANSRLNQATKELKRAVKYNGMEVPEEELEKILMSDVQSGDKEPIEEDITLLQALLRSGALRLRLCVCFIWWASALFVFYGLAVHSHSLAGSTHLNYALLASAELPALAINTLLLDRVGRRRLLTAAFLLTAVTLITIPCLPDPSAWPGTVLYLLGKMGATMTLNALYLYTSELFPTRARQRLLAMCSAFGRLGSVLAPLTPLLAVYNLYLPTIMFGSLPLVSAMLTRLVPETHRQKLPDTFADLEKKPCRNRNQA